MANYEIIFRHIRFVQLENDIITLWECQRFSTLFLHLFCIFIFGIFLSLCLFLEICTRLFGVSIKFIKISFTFSASESIFKILIKRQEKCVQRTRKISIASYKRWKPTLHIDNN